MIVGTTGSVWRLLRWQLRSVVLFGVAATVVVVLHQVLGLKWVRIPPLPVAVVGGALGIFVSFRTNASYARWWEGRQLWGRLVNNSRVFCTQILTYVPGDDVQRTLIDRHILYVHVLRCLLRDEDPWVDAEVLRFSTAEQRAELAVEGNAPHALLHAQHALLAKLADERALSELRLDALDRTMAALLDVQGGCERIKRTPMPRTYGLFSQELARAYGILFPLAIVADTSYATIPINIVVCLAFVMISEVGRILEDPFTMFFNGLPLSALSRTIENNLRARRGERDLEPMLKPDERGILM